ncbi:hypothetical protein C8J55DRAFT_527260 [Lentinula edodes]|uniref:Uncharacterized protein n=1 Tax=Lentinula lateritia TaxID=40482 RepID=A0A9W8ZU46_9AGAR|nr:hypothetical protein C8J55DRAFT_527260 [Lentinula edodes]
MDNHCGTIYLHSILIYVLQLSVYCSLSISSLNLIIRYQHCIHDGKSRLGLRREWRNFLVKFLPIAVKDDKKSTWLVLSRLLYTLLCLMLIEKDQEANGKLGRAGRCMRMYAGQPLAIDACPSNLRRTSSNFIFCDTQLSRTVQLLEFLAVLFLKFSRIFLEFLSPIWACTGPQLQNTVHYKTDPVFFQYLYYSLQRERKRAYITSSSILTIQQAGLKKIMITTYHLMSSSIMERSILSRALDSFGPWRLSDVVRMYRNSAESPGAL